MPQFRLSPWIPAFAGKTRPCLRVNFTETVYYRCSKISCAIVAAVIAVGHPE